MNERRVHLRVPVGLEGTYQLLGDLSGPRLGMTEDVSLGGLRLSSADRLQPGDSVAITLKFPEQGQVSVTGVVVWSREFDESGQRNFESGLRWTEIDAHAKARLNAFVTEYTRGGLRSFATTFAGITLLSPVRWQLAVGTGLALFAIGMLLFSQWMEHRRLLTEAQSLRQAVGFYQDITRSTPKTP